MENLTGKIKRILHKVSARLVALVLRPGAVHDPENFRLWESRGYHITPVHFYSPIPHSRDVEKNDFQKLSCPGIDFHPEHQLRLLIESFTQFSQEYNAIPIKPTGSTSFYLDNDAFIGIDPYIFYCMIRQFKPSTVVEVGSGHSTLLGVQASQVSNSTRYICIDPWPREFIARGVPGIEFIRQKVEDLDIDLFLALKQNDILFVDSSHVVRTGGDVNFILLEVLPRLAPGVIVHFHDIFLPYDYPKEWIVQQQRFWTEQYLLQAYLTENNRVEVLFSTYFISKRHREEIRQTFPNALWIGGSSFWIRKY